MPTFERIKELNDLLLRPSFRLSYLTFKDYLEQQFDVFDYSERSFSRDIRALKLRINERYPTLEEVHGDLLRFHRSGNFYQYVRNDISAFPTFSEKELNQIASAINFNKHLFTEGQGAGIVNKLRAISLENNLSKFHRILPWSAIQLIKEGERSGSEKLNQIIEYIYAQQIIEITHQGISAHSKLKKTLALPLLVKEYNNGWYTGWYVLFQKIDELLPVIKLDLDQAWLYALDRINSMATVSAPSKIRIPEGFNPSDYFKNILGIYRNSSNKGPIKVERILIKVSNTSWMSNYIQKYPIHESQHISEISVDFMLVEFHLEINQELKNFLFRYSHELEVLEPSQEVLGH
jgi:predicted DNA-binding transcriptional regulator YafY